jgi:hypothetical protein
MSLPIIQHLRHDARASIGYEITRYDNLDDDAASIDPNAPASELPEVGNIAGVNLGLSYSNLESVRHGYRRETGRKIDVAMTVYDRALGSDHDTFKLEGSYDERLRMPWRGHQVLALRLSGGTSSGGLKRRGVFQLGGYPSQQDVLRTLLTRGGFGETLSGNTMARLRGYGPAGSAFSGSYYSALNVDYRIPIVDVDRGIDAIPVFLSRVVLIGFTDWGLAWTNPIKAADLAGSVGATLVFDFSLGYGEGVDLFVQYAHGFDPQKGLDYVRAVVARSF